MEVKQRSVCRVMNILGVDGVFPFSGGSVSRQLISKGGVPTGEVVMRKRSENRGYYDENVRDSIVMGDGQAGFMDGMSMCLCQCVYVCVCVKANGFGGVDAWAKA